MATLGVAFGVPIGYSDHTVGNEVTFAAVALGACIVEKHLTLNRNLTGPDHKASLEPDEFAAVVRGIRIVESALGSGRKAPSASELKIKQVARKSIVASRPIIAGEVFSVANLSAKRPGNGISPMRWDELIGKPSKRDYSTDELIEPQ
jgi:sialic acid synthase SpsE